MLSSVLIHLKMFTAVPVQVFPLYLQIHLYVLTILCSGDLLHLGSSASESLVAVLPLLLLVPCEMWWDMLKSPWTRIQSLSCNLFSLSCSCTFFRTWGLVSVFCLFLFSNSSFVTGTACCGHTSPLRIWDLERWVSFQVTERDLKRKVNKSAILEMLQKGITPSVSIEDEMCCEVGDKGNWCGKAYGGWFWFSNLAFLLSFSSWWHSHPGFFPLPVYSQNIPITPSFSSVSVDGSARGGEEGDPYPSIHPLLYGAGKPEANTALKSPCPGWQFQ